MMRPATIAAIAAVLAGAPAAVAHQGDRVVLVPELTDAALAAIDVHDGRIDEWLLLLGEPALTDADFEFSVSGRSTERTLQLRVWLAWHGASHRIFAAVETADDLYVNEPPGDGWTGYLLENDTFLGLAVDADHSGDDWYSRERGPGASMKSHRLTQEYHFLGVALGSAVHVALPETAPGPVSFAARPPYSDAGGGVFSEQPTITVTEAYATVFADLDWTDPVASRPADLQAGRVVGLALKVTDADVSPRFRVGSTYSFPRTWGRRKTSPDAWDSSGMYSGYFADALLLPAHRVGEDAAELGVDSWARIKVALRAAAKARP